MCCLLLGVKTHEFCLKSESIVGRVSDSVTRHDALQNAWLTLSLRQATKLVSFDSNTERYNLKAQCVACF